ncbi:MAG: TPM domain-containing protein [Aquabacterium sp.]
MPQIAALPWPQRLARILRHGFSTERQARAALDASALARIAEHVRQSESRHRGEIRVCVEAGLPWSYLWKGLRARQRAVMLFGKLRVWDTEENSGVLIYLLLADHAIEILADRGLARQVPAQTWQDQVRQLGESFRAGRHEAGLIETVDAVGALLQRHFPADAARPNPNELPDQVDLR